MMIGLAKGASRSTLLLVANASRRLPMRGLLHSEGYRPLFSGHETFALRQLWLKRAVDAVGHGVHSNRAPSGGAGRGRTKNVFSEDSAIVTLGVGKNMVGSIRHWATACDVLADVDGLPRPGNSATEP